MYGCTDDDDDDDDDDDVVVVVAAAAAASVFLRQRQEHQIHQSINCASSPAQFVGPKTWMQRSQMSYDVLAC